MNELNALLESNKSLAQLSKEKKLDEVCKSIREILKENDFTYHQAIEVFEYLKIKLKYVAKIS